MLGREARVELPERARVVLHSLNHYRLGLLESRTYPNWDKCFPALRAAAGTRLREVIIEAALGRVPDETPGDKQKPYKSQAQTWFKSIEGGRELAQKVFALELWPHLSAQLMPFCNAVRNAVGLHDIEDIER